MCGKTDSGAFCLRVSVGSFSSHLLSTYYVPSTVIGPESVPVNKVASLLPGPNPQPLSATRPNSVNSRWNPRAWSSVRLPALCQGPESCSVWFSTGVRPGVHSCDDLQPPRKVCRSTLLGAHLAPCRGVTTGKTVRLTSLSSVWLQVFTSGSLDSVPSETGLLFFFF